MKKWIVLMVSFSALGLSGCASHYHRLDGGSVRLYLTDPEASAVSFAHSVDGYQLHRAQKAGIWTWEVAVPGRSEFSYFYLVDGNTYLPKCRFREQDDFGTQNCIYSPEM